MLIDLEADELAEREIAGIALGVVYGQKYGDAEANAAKTHCWRGHPYTPENTILSKTRFRAGEARSCRTCAAARKREWRRRNPELARAQRHLTYLGEKARRKGGGS